jgi:hypothetical protein
VEFFFRELLEWRGALLYNYESSLEGAQMMNEQFSNPRPSHSEPEVFRTMEMAAKSTHEILKKAAEDRFDVWILCGGMHQRDWHEYYQSVTDADFTVDLRQILEQGRDISLFIWADVNRGNIWRDLLDLARTANESRQCGHLRIYSSGTTRLADEVTHFVLGKSRDNHQWILRIEDQHLTRGPGTLESADVVSVVFWDTPSAKQFGTPLLETFEHLVSLLENKVSKAAPVKSPTVARHAV